MPYFVFAEFSNPQVSDFLVNLRNALQCTNSLSPVHVTLRGPHANPPSPDELKTYSERLLGYGVRIGNYGYFSTPKGYVAFLLAECTVFKDLWDKPDYKNPSGFIKPHITMFESTVRKAALEVRAFLREENLKIHTYNISLSVYESRPVQGDLFGRPILLPSETSKNHDVFSIPKGILDRARLIGTKLAEKCKETQRAN